ncbi:MAG: DciA family protein [Candidatus Limnocylindria bacterium]
MPGRPTRAATAVEAALREQLGADGPNRLAAAQARIAWDEVVVEELGDAREMPASALVGLARGVASVEVADAMLAQELRLRKPGILRRLNARLRDRPGSGAPVVELRIRVNRRLA